MIFDGQKLGQVRSWVCPHLPTWSEDGARLVVGRWGIPSLLEENFSLGGCDGPVMTKLGLSALNGTMFGMAVVPIPPEVLPGWTGIQKTSSQPGRSSPPMKLYKPYQGRDQGTQQSVLWWH